MKIRERMVETMAKLTSPEKLKAEIDAILKDYQAGVIKGVNKAIGSLANKGRNSVRRNARQVTSPGRANSWMYRLDPGSNYGAAEAVIYNKSQPGIGHLIEHGHAKTGGGRTKPREHVKPVEDELENTAIREVLKNI